MQQPDLTELMHAVLDGEASAAQVRELLGLMAADPAAQAEFAELQQLFHGLASMPSRHPPEGLVAAVMASVPERSGHTQEFRTRRQPFSWSRVFGSDPQVSASRNSTPVRRASLSASTTRSVIMGNGTNGSQGKRRLWIGGAVAAVAAVAVVQFGLGGYPNDKDVIGTIVPAERYRAPQATAEDIRVGTPQAGQTAQPGATARSEAAQAAAQSAAERDSMSTAEKSALSVAERTAQGAAERGAMSAAEKSAQSAAERSAMSAAEKSAQGVAQKSAQSAAEKSAQSAAERGAMSAAERSAQSAAEKSAQSAAQKSAQSAAEKSAQSAAERAAMSAAEKAAQSAAQLRQ